MIGWLNILATLTGMALMFGAMFKFMWSRLDKKFESNDEKFQGMKNELNERFNKCDDNFKNLQERLAGVETVLRSLDSRISRLEGQDEERFRNEVKLIIKGQKI